MSTPSSSHAANQGDIHGGRSCQFPHIILPKLRNELAEVGTTLVSVNLAGTECYDYSTMGTGRGLNGPTCKTLSIFLSQRRRSQEDQIRGDWLTC